MISIINKVTKEMYYPWAFKCIRRYYSPLTLASKSSKIRLALLSYIFSILPCVGFEPNMYKTNRTGVATKSVIMVNIGTPCDLISSHWIDILMVSNSFYGWDLEGYGKLMFCDIGVYAYKNCAMYFWKVSEFRGCLC